MADDEMSYCDGCDRLHPNAELTLDKRNGRRMLCPVCYRHGRRGPAGPPAPTPAAPCRQCGKPLPRNRITREETDEKGWPVRRHVGFAKDGYAGNGYFCTATCGFRFAVAVLERVAEKERKGA
jgi:hypothetical protein